MYLDMGFEVGRGRGALVLLQEGEELRGLEDHGVRDVAGHLELAACQ